VSVPGAGQPLLEVRGLCVDYGAGRDAVHAVIGADLVLHGGEVLGLAGESGSGKSTLAYAITRLLRAPGMITGGSVGYHPDPGRTVDLLAADESALRVLRWSQISVVLQSAMNALNPVLSIRSQLTDVLRAHQPGMSQAERRARAAGLLAMVGITADRLRSHPHQLSGGMRQRVMIAMALACNPKLLIADEPTTALDVTIQAQILDLMRELKQKIDAAIVLITHDLGVVAEMAQRVVVMYAGRKAEEAPVGTLFRRPLHPYTRGLLASVPRLGDSLARERLPRLAEIPGTVPSLKDEIPGCPFAARCPFATDVCRREMPAFEEKEAGHYAACFHSDAVAQA
jgi:peptide/nickel transport system ATP-binding protein